VLEIEGDVDVMAVVRAAVAGICAAVREAGFDAPAVPVATGGRRLHRYADYVAALNGNIEPYEGYLQAFRYGMPPHGGFALGLERWTPRVVGAANVREPALFPRDRHRLVPEGRVPVPGTGTCPAQPCPAAGSQWRRRDHDRFGWVRSLTRARRRDLAR